MYRGNCLKGGGGTRGLGQFANLKGGLPRRREWCFLRGGWYSQCTLWDFKDASGFNQVKVLNMAIWLFICNGYAEFWIYLIMATYASIMHKYASAGLKKFGACSCHAPNMHQTSIGGVQNIVHQHYFSW